MQICAPVHRSPRVPDGAHFSPGDLRHLASRANGERVAARERYVHPPLDALATAHSWVRDSPLSPAPVHARTGPLVYGVRGSAPRSPSPLSRSCARAKHMSGDHSHPRLRAERAQGRVAAWETWRVTAPPAVARLPPASCTPSHHSGLPAHHRGRDREGRAHWWHGEGQYISSHCSVLEN